MNDLIFSKSDVISTTRQYFQGKPTSGLRELLEADTDYAEVVLCSIGYALGYRNLRPEHIDDKILIIGKNLADVDETVFSFDKGTKNIEGDGYSLAKKIYLLVGSLENELESVIYYAPELRVKRIQEVCLRLGIDAETYQRVLKNWFS